MPSIQPSCADGSIDMTTAANIKECPTCKNMVQLPHPKWECHDLGNIKVSSDRAYEMIEVIKRTSEYITIRKDMLHRILKDAWREGYEKGKALKK